MESWEKVVEIWEKVRESGRKWEKVLALNTDSGIKVA
jgi:hypothetical protein